MRIRSGSRLDENGNLDISALLNDDDYRPILDKDELLPPDRTSQPKDMSLLSVLPVPDLRRPGSSSPRVVFGGVAPAAGPPIGSVDVGISDSSYYFCVSLPGVRRDPGMFSCEIEGSGRVLIRGVTAGIEKTFQRQSEVFEVKHQNLCATGEFTVSFSLPGPVVPRMFSFNFQVGSIFEGVVLKAKSDA